MERVGLTLFPSTSSSIADATSQVLPLYNLEEPTLSQYRLDPSEYCEYPLARLYSMYWDKGDQYLNSCKPFIPLPPDVVLDDELYFSQCSYTEQRIDNFRKNYRDEIISKGWRCGIPPGLALIGTPGIGELVPIHFFI
jgi:hypothetical protein